MKDGKKSVWLTPEEWEWIKAMRAAKVCAEKRPFDTPELAKRAAIQEMMKTRGLKIYVYECPICLKWHMTRNVQKKRNG